MLCRRRTYREIRKSKALDPPGGVDLPRRLEYRKCQPESAASSPSPGVQSLSKVATRGVEVQSSPTEQGLPCLIRAVAPLDLKDGNRPGERRAKVYPILAVVSPILILSVPASASALSRETVRAAHIRQRALAAGLTGPQLF